MLAQEGGIKEGVRRTRVDQRLNGDRRLTGDEDVDQQGKVTGNGVGEGTRERKGGRREGGSNERGRRGGVVMHEEEQKGDAKVREPRDQSIQGLCRDNQGKPSTNWK